MSKVTYSGNGADGGAIPIDSNPYKEGDTVNVAGNDSTTAPHQQNDDKGNPENIVTGNLAKTGATFAYWNTKPDGTGDFHGWPADTSFSIGAADVTLYAQWFVATGLPNGGKTTHYAFSYDSTLAASGLEPARTLALMNSAEKDYDIMQGWFPGVTPSGSSQRSVYVTRLGGGANNTGDIRLKPNTNDVNELRCYLVSEITESFMQGQNKGWGFLPGPGDSNENSCGEGLSLFLTQQFAAQHGFANPYTAFTANTANGWLNSSLPASDSNSTRFFDKTSEKQGYDYGSRFDYVNKTLPWFGNGPGTGCSILFIYYLFHQLGFSINDIIEKAPGYTNGVLNATAPLRGVYQNLTGDNSDPFPEFLRRLNYFFNPDKQASIPGPNPDDPFPLTYITIPTLDIGQEASYVPASPEIVDHGRAMVSPFDPQFCPPKEYQYDVGAQDVQLTFTPKPVGLGDIVLQWSINGHPVGDIDLVRSLTLTVQSFTPDPKVSGGGVASSEVITLNYHFEGTGLYQKLIVTIPRAGLTGNPTLYINLSGHNDYQVPPHTYSPTLVVVPEQFTILWEPQYYIDQGKCVSAWNRAMHQKKDGPFFILQTLPDPPVDWNNAVAYLRGITAEIEQIAQKNPAQARAIKTFVAQKLMVNEIIFDSVKKGEQKA